MDVAEFAARLADADDAERAALLERYAALVDSDLARALKRLYDDTESSDPTRAAGAAIAPQQLVLQRDFIRVGSGTPSGASDATDRPDDWRLANTPTPPAPSAQ